MSKKYMTNIVSILLFVGNCVAVMPEKKNEVPDACKAVDSLEAYLLEMTRNRLLKKAKLRFPTTPYVPGIKFACVKLSFTINGNGKAENIKIIDSYPKRYLDRESIRALREYEFIVSEKNDVEMEQRIVIKVDPNNLTVR